MSKAKKVLNIVINVLLVIFFIICLLALIVTVSSKKSRDGGVNIFGYQMRVVVSPSMEKSDAVDVSGYEIKSIPVKSMVFIQLVPEDEQAANEWYAQLKVGDVLTFHYAYASEVVITHRIVDIHSNSNGGYTILLQGDNRESDDGVATQTIDTSIESVNYVIGKVTGQSFALGVLITGIKTPVGIVLLVIVPCAIIIIVEVIKVVETLHGEKMKKAAEAEQQKVDEIEELKKQIAMLQKEQGNAPPKDDATAEEAQDGTDE